MIGLIRISTLFLFSFGELQYYKKISMLPGLQFKSRKLCAVICHYICNTEGIFEMSLLSSLIQFIGLFSCFTLLILAKNIYLFHSFKERTLGFIDSLHCFLDFYTVDFVILFLFILSFSYYILGLFSLPSLDI